MRCEYCHSDKQEGGNCSRCGAPLPEKNAEYPADPWKSEPFFYNGYICYSLRHYEIDAVEVQFWLGMELIERIEVTSDLVRKWTPEGYDYMSFFWDLFLLAHGDIEVLKYQEKNNKYPAMFEIRRIENPEKECLHSLSLVEQAQEISGAAR